MRRTVENTLTSGSATPMFFYAQMLMIISARPIVVPVRPIPAEQCTTAFSEGCEEIRKVIKMSIICLKEVIEFPLGTP